MNGMILCAVLDKTSKLSIVDGLLLAVIGIALVFAVLIVLMFIIWAMGKIVDNSSTLQTKHPEFSETCRKNMEKIEFWKRKKTAAPKTVAAPTPAEPQPQPQPLAHGTCGELKLINTSERDAAMIMAIVADATETPLNELRFKSIKKIDGGNQK